MYSTGFVLKLKPDCYDEYKRRHDELWPEMTKAIDDNGIGNYIYRFGDWLFVHGTAPSKEVWDLAGQNPIIPKWNKYMADVLETDDDGKIYVQDLPLAFACGEFAPK